MNLAYLGYDISVPTWAWVAASIAAVTALGLIVYDIYKSR